MKCVNGLINFIYAQKKKKKNHLSSTLALDIKLGLAPFHAKQKCWALLAKLSIETTSYVWTCWCGDLMFVWDYMKVH